MANIKFSDFTVGNTEGDIDFVVGYKGASNIQISPTNLLASALGNYLPLAGGTMTGDIAFNDNVKARFGTGLDSYIQHTGTNTEIINATGNLNIKSTAADGDITFYADNGSGGTTEYFRLDGSTRSLVVSAGLGMYFNDGAAARFGTSGDMILYHSGSHSYLENYTGDLVILNNADNKDIIFQSDNGSGGLAEYFKLDGSRADGNYTYTTRPDGGVITFGGNLDLRIWRDPIVNNSFIRNYNDDFIIENVADDKDIIFNCDDGSGGTATYFYLDGSSSKTVFPDNKQIQIGSGGGDGYIYSDGTNMWIQGNNPSADIKLYQGGTDGSIRFYSDNGSGGVAEYFAVDGGEEQVRFFKDTEHQDGIYARFGNSSDLSIVHTGSTGYIQNYTGDLQIQSNGTDKDILLRSDDGSGGLATYFTLDGSLVQMWADKDIQFSDNIKAKFGGSSDLQIYHNNSNDRGYIYNATGDLYIENDATDGDIKFFSDDGSGGTTEYFRVDGGEGETIFSRNTQHLDNVYAQFGTGKDLKIYHDGNNSNYITSTTSDIYLRNEGNNDRTYIQATNNGTIYNYITIDGSADRAVFSRSTRHIDGAASTFGTNESLQIYHDGNNSYIKDVGTGFLNISSDAALVLANAAGEPYFIGTSNGSTKLYYDNSSKLETTSTGIKISGVSEYADNTAAIAGGLTTGDVYRTGDLLKIVH